jgi:hypothetical protein
MVKVSNIYSFKYVDGKQYYKGTSWKRIAFLRKLHDKYLKKVRLPLKPYMALRITEQVNNH